MLQCVKDFLHLGGWDIKERVYRNVKGQFIPQGKANWHGLLRALANGEHLTPAQMADRYGWQADRLLRERGILKRKLDAADIRVVTKPWHNNQVQKYIARCDLEKAREMVGKIKSVEV